MSKRYAEIEAATFVNEYSLQTTYSSPVNFHESMSKPRHRWFPYKEGFSPSFVSEFVAGSSVPNGSVIFDPFSGSGTTCIVAGELGYRSVGLDVSPLTVFISKAKSLQLTLKEHSDFERTIQTFLKSKLPQPAEKPTNATVERYFEPVVFEALLRVKRFCDDLEPEKLKTLFKLAFLNAIEPFSTHRKAGNGVKKKTNYPGFGPDDAAELALVHPRRAKVRTPLAPPHKAPASGTPNLHL